MLGIRLIFKCIFCLQINFMDVALGLLFMNIFLLACQFIMKHIKLNLKLYLFDLNQTRTHAFNIQYNRYRTWSMFTVTFLTRSFTVIFNTLFICVNYIYYVQRLIKEDNHGYGTTLHPLQVHDILHDQFAYLIDQTQNELNSYTNLFN